jgi:hypothetical protein
MRFGCPLRFPRVPELPCACSSSTAAPTTSPPTASPTPFLGAWACLCACPCVPVRECRSARVYARARAHEFVCATQLRARSCVLVQTYMRACPDSYVFGDLDSNTCPAGSYRITDAAQCEAAATAAGIAWGGPTFLTDLPTGCVWNIPEGSSPGVGGGQKVLLNTATANGHRIYERLICGRGTGLAARPHSCPPARTLFLSGSRNPQARAHARTRAHATVGAR